ncbi:MAG: histone deacetylase superfamily [Gemmatimonadetes bacterium]|nr:histone deacetylase superfamily [Gemmatimonadota bacterium]
MTGVRAFYCDRFVLPLPPGHRFPMVKYARVRERCLAEGVLAPGDLAEPPAAGWDELALVHDDDYVRRVRTGTLEPQAQRRIGFPWSAEMVERSRRSVGATIAGGRVALDEAAERGWGVAANLAGGTHHAYAGHGEGFCVFNDAAVAIRVLQREGRIRRAAVLDCDVHQGNGTAALFASDPSVFTFSIHGSGNYPFRKERSSLDVELPDRAGDDAFLAALDLHVPTILHDFRPDLAVYLAGADPWRDDRYGRLAMSKEGLASRDRLVLSACREAGVPVVVTMAGGYARDTEDTVDVHVATLRIAAELHRARAASAQPVAAAEA